MIRSMTAFARSPDTGAGKGWEIEIRSVNHRFFEFSFKAPSNIASYEARIKAIAQTKLRRGKVMISISSSSGEDDWAKKVTIDETLVSSYLNAVSALKEKMKLSGELSLRDILMLPKVFSTEREEELTEELWQPLEREVKAALDIMVENRQTEGRKLADDMRARLASIEKACAAVRALSAGQSGRIMSRLSERIQALLKDKEMDQDRLYREVAFLVERGDITEELVRLESHLRLFHDRLDSDQEVGRELDFLCQEVNREINTLGSKSQVFDISTEVIHMKTELEKIREQVQNIE